MAAEFMDSALYSLKMQRLPRKRYNNHSMTAKMSLLCLPDRLPNGFTARLAIAKYIRIGSSNTSNLGGLSIVGTAAAC